MNAGLLSRISEAGNTAGYVFTISPTGLDPLRYAAQDVTSASTYHYDGRIEGMGQISYNISDRSGSLNSAAMSLSVIDDETRIIERYVEGSRGQNMFTAPVTIQLAEASTLPADYETVAQMRVESISKSESRKWTFGLKNRDLELKRRLLTLTANEGDWPSIPDENIGKLYPAVYGRFDSRSIGSAGALPTIEVDDVNFYYLVCLGYATAVPRVYKAGVLMSSGYTIVRTSRNGIQFTYIDLASDPTGSVITCDAYGYESVGGGTGTYFDNGPDILKHALVNFAYQQMNNTTSNWGDDADAPVDTTSFTAAKNFYDTRRTRSSLYIDTETTGNSLISSFCSDFWAKCNWTKDGKISILAEDTDPRPSGGLYSTSHLHGEYDRDKFGVQYDQANRISSIAYSFCSLPTGDSKGKSEVRDFQFEDTAKIEATNTWFDVGTDTLPTFLTTAMSGYAGSACTGWWRVDTHNGADGDTLQTLSDESGNARNFTQATAGNRPTIRTGKSGINGRMALEFDGSTDFMDTAAAFSSFFANNEGTAYAVFQPTAIDTNAANIDQNDAVLCDTGGFFGIHLKSAPTVHAYNFDTTRDDPGGQAIVLGTPYVVRWQHTGGNVTISVNGATAVSTASGNTGTISNPLRIGRANGAFYFTGLIGEVITFNLAVTTDDSRQIFNYLMKKWAI